MNATIHTTRNPKGGLTMNTKKWLKTTLLALLCGASILTPTLRGDALAISCGDTLGPGGSYVLDADLLNCPAEAVALNVIGPVDVDLNGHTVACATHGSIFTIGIEVTGKKAQIHDGKISTCYVGVQLSSGTKHQLSYLTAQETPISFSIQSDKTKLDHNASVCTSPYCVNSLGFSILGSNNTLDHNEAYDGLEGFIVGCDNNHLTNNTSNNNNWNGFFLGSNVQNTVLSGNTAIGNSLYGFWISGNATHLKKNQASKNQYGIWADLGTTNSVITANTVTDNLIWDLDDG